MVEAINKRKIYIALEGYDLYIAMDKLALRVQDMKSDYI